MWPTCASIRLATFAVEGDLSMKLFVALVAGVVVSVAPGTFALAQSAAPGISIYAASLLEPNQKTSEVTTDELRRILSDGSAVVFDARPPMEFAVSHIPGARNVGQKAGTPISLYVSDVEEIGRQVPDRGTPIVLYCNGPFCGKSKRLSEELLQAGYTSVRRYQLGAPTWRALVGTMQIELDGARYVAAGDRTAVFLDARSADEFGAGSVDGARNVPVAEVVAAKDDGRLPMEDHNTRIIVFGSSPDQARKVSDLVAANAFHNVTFYAGALEELQATVRPAAL
jgi:rhodanese-related sulfurtransferase